MSSYSALRAGTALTALLNPKFKCDTVSKYSNSGRTVRCARVRHGTASPRCGSRVFARISKQEFFFIPLSPSLLSPFLSSFFGNDRRGCEHGPRKDHALRNRRTTTANGGRETLLERESFEETARFFGIVNERSDPAEGPHVAKRSGRHRKRARRREGPLLERWRTENASGSA